jgi:hypothetical protein
MSDRNDKFKERLCWLLEAGGAHDAFESMVADIPANKRGARSHGTPYTPWRVLEHMRLAQNDILEYARDPDYESPPYPEGFWPAEEGPGGDDAWQESVRRFKKDNRELRDLIKSADDVEEQIPHAQPGHTLLRQALLAADHNSYHLGQMEIVRRLIGEFPDYDEAPDNI